VKQASKTETSPHAGSAMWDCSWDSSESNWATSGSSWPEKWESSGGETWQQAKLVNSSEK